MASAATTMTSDRFNLLGIGYGIGETDCCQNAALDDETESADTFLNQVRACKERPLNAFQSDAGCPRLHLRSLNLREPKRANAAMKTL